MHKCEMSQAPCQHDHVWWQDVVLPKEHCDSRVEFLQADARELDLKLLFAKCQVRSSLSSSTQCVKNPTQCVKNFCLINITTSVRAKCPGRANTDADVWSHHAIAATTVVSYLMMPDTWNLLWTNVSSPKSRLCLPKSQLCSISLCNPGTSCL